MYMCIIRITHEKHNTQYICVAPCSKANDTMINYKHFSNSWDFLLFDRVKAFSDTQG